MRHLTTRLLLLSAVFTTTAAALCAQDARSAPPLVGTVTKVQDGDTYTVEIKLRVHYLDAPELAQPHGREAAAHARELLLGQRVTFAPVGRSYDRVVADVSLGGIDLAEYFVRRGDAMLDARFQPPKNLQDAESEAKSETRGVWGDETAVPPWVFRHRKRGGQR